jgi:hypothetical protein
MGDVDRAREEEALCAAPADRLTAPALLVVFAPYRATRATLDGSGEEAQRWIAEGMELYRRTQVWPAEDARLGLVAPLAVEWGGAHELVDQLLAFADAAGPDGRAAVTFAMIVLAETGDRDRLRRELEARGPLPERFQDWAWLAMTCGLSAVAVAAGDATAASRFAEELAPFAGWLALFGSDGCFDAVDGSAAAAWRYWATRRLATASSQLPLCIGPCEHPTSKHGRCCTTPPGWQRPTRLPHGRCSTVPGNSPHGRRRCRHASRRRTDRSLDMRRRCSAGCAGERRSAKLSW